MYIYVYVYVETGKDVEHGKRKKSSDYGVWENHLWPWLGYGRTPIVILNHWLQPISWW